MRVLLMLISLFFVQIVFASNKQHIEQIFNQEEAPFGIIFEIIESDKDALKWAIPQINQYAKKLRKKFPDIGIAVVSHGSEQFGLLKSKQKDNFSTHQLVKSLVSNDVNLHVCGTHASWKGKNADDFPDYIDVTPAGPTAINNYEEMGYELIVIYK